MSALLFSVFLWFLLASLLGVFVYVLAITLRVLLTGRGRRRPPDGSQR
ncbi:MAG: hypothetical protein ACE5I4_00605 [Thermoplasmata archaeon]